LTRGFPSRGVSSATLHSVPSPVRVLLPWGFLSLQSTWGEKTSALLVRRSLYGLTALAAAWEVFAFPLVPANLHLRLTLS
jgi:hypothetical protein